MWDLVTYKTRRKVETFSVGIASMYSKMAYL